MVSDSQTVGYQFFIGHIHIFCTQVCYEYPNLSTNRHSTGMSLHATNSVTHPIRDKLSNPLMIHSEFIIWCAGNGSDIIISYVNTVIFCFGLLKDTEITACTHEELFRK